MGVKELWSLIDKVKVHKTFCEITNETVAVDLSTWIVDSQSVGTVKPHLGNLFFRTSALLQARVLPIFVTKGKPPELEWKTMMDQQNVRQGRKTSRSVVTKKKSIRSHFNQVIKECCEMLEVMGVSYIQSDGEAEAACAALNAAGVVDAVITDDGDTFLYGAKKLYKNVTTSKDQSVDSYSMVDIEATIGLTRDDMIALALLLGCDYCPKGVPGIGKAIALKFFEELSGENMLIRMKQWKAGISSNASRTEQLIAAKATKVDRFPDQRIIDEYNNTSCEISKAERSWNRPNITKFQEFCLKKLDWVYSYALEKILPLATLWDMKYILKHSYPYTNSLQPERIVKSHVQQGVKSLEIIWLIKDNCLLEDGEHFLTDQNRTTTEEYSLIKKCFPDAVEQFEEEKAAQQNDKEKQTETGKIAAVEGMDIETDDICSSDDCLGDDIMKKSSSAKKLARMKSASEKARSKQSFKHIRTQNSDNASKLATNSLKNSRKSTRNKRLPKYNEQTDSNECEEEEEASLASKINLKCNKQTSSTKALTKRKFTETDASDDVMSFPKKKLRKQPELLLKIHKVDIENIPVCKKSLTKRAASTHTQKSAAVSRTKKKRCTTEKKQIHGEAENSSEQPSTSAKIKCSDNMSDSDSDVEWEEVEELPDASARKAPLQVTLETNMRKSKRDKIVAYAKMLWNRYKRKIHESVHKIELMCLMTHGRMVNEVCNSPLLRALIMSVHSSTNLEGNKLTMKSVKSFISNLIKRFSLSDKQYLASPTNIYSLEDDLSTALQTYEVKCETHLVLLIIAILRFFGATVRFCMAWNPITFKIAQYQKKERLRKSGSEQASPEVSKNKKIKKGKSHDSGSDSDDSLTKTSKRTMRRKCKDRIDYQNYWLEVYVEKRWVPVECVSVTIDDVQAISNRLAKPMTYIISYNNSGKVKDVSARYDPVWMLSTRKLRVEQSWWDEMIKPYHVKESQQTREEDQEILNKLENMPFPKTISGFKDHPLYALERHLLKFEAIYPSTSVPLGYTEKTREPIYSRSCVKTLHTRETWLKEAKQVKLGEQPYKFVKPRPKMNEKVKITKATQPVFGYWQTEPYVPPIAENGKVPRNAYGNVDLFKPEMLPVGCVHIPTNGVGKLARKLDIDCAQAMIGWEIHGGFTCPIFDGWIVCQEYEQTLLDAWEEFEAEERRKEQVKIEKIIYGKWKTLIKGLLIRERLRNRYGSENF